MVTESYRFGPKFCLKCRALSSFYAHSAWRRDEPQRPPVSNMCFIRTIDNAIQGAFYELRNTIV